jgi:hypothetical protein
LGAAARSRLVKSSRALSRSWSRSSPAAGPELGLDEEAMERRRWLESGDWSSLWEGIAFGVCE